jgi:hypothetical protein
MRELFPRPYFCQDTGIPDGMPGFDAQQSHEEAILTEATCKIALLYAVDIIASLTDTPTVERNQVWEQTAQKYPQFGNQIRELKQALLVAENTRNEYYRSLNPLFALRIGDYEDDMAGRFLTDVLLSRITTASGDLIRERQQLIEERDSMYRELGFQEGRRTPTDEFVTVQKAVGAVLQGRLRVLSNS